MQVRKRDGRIVPFDRQRISNAIEKAFKEVLPDEKDAKQAIEHITKNVVFELTLKTLGDEPIDIEHIQDLVEKELMAADYYSVAKAYILYRQHRSDMRKINSNRIKNIDKIINADIENTDEGRENANIDTREVMGALLKIGSDALKEFNLLKCMKPKHAQYHRSGIWHENDLDFSCMACNCLYLPLRQLLMNGFNTGHGSIRTPNTIGAASTLTCIIIQSNQNCMFQ